MSSGARRPSLAVAPVLSANQILLGLGLVLALAVSAQLAARVLGVPSLVILLPAGFVAGIATDDVHPDKLLGALYQPFVSIAVGLILFEAGLRLSLGEIDPGVRKAVTRLVLAGAALTWLAITGSTALLYRDMDLGVAFLIGAILVVSGPAVVLPLLAFIRPAGAVRALVKWEGTLVDPIGALLGVVVFVAVGSGRGWRPGALLLDLLVGTAVAAVGGPVLWLLLRAVHRSAPRMVVATTLMVVVGVVVVADLIRADAGLLAAVLLGILVANQRSIDVSRSLFEFHDVLVQLLIGVLFVLVSASVTPAELRSVMPEALALVAIMILVIRPAVVALSLAGSSFSRNERAFVAWMAPRGIVAGATASAFGSDLAQKGVAGAGKVLPIVFFAIFGTVVVYGLTAAPVARRLGVSGLGQRLVLLVGGQDWARELAAALKRAGVAVRMWVGPLDQQAAARESGLDADRGRIMVDAISREAELEEVTDALVLTASDDFNTLCAAELRNELGHGHVFRVAPHPDQPDLLPPPKEVGILANESLTFAQLEQEFAAGRRLLGVEVGDDPLAEGAVPLFAISPTGQLSIAADGRPPVARRGDTLLVLPPRGGSPRRQGHP
jgi:NhaP-type Na+/H+ or K+/H+ antiporter